MWYFKGMRVFPYDKLDCVCHHYEINSTKSHEITNQCPDRPAYNTSSATKIRNSTRTSAFSIHLIKSVQTVMEIDLFCQEPGLR